MLDNHHHHVFRVAERAVAFDTPVPELAAFGAGRAQRPRGGGSGPPPPPASATREHLTFDGESDLGNGRRRIECRWGSRGYELAIGGVGRFRVTADGCRIACEQETGRDGVAFAEAACGPALISALALRGVWCLHASAVMRGGEAVAFVGESGAGKSTLAAALPGLCPGGAVRTVADDVLPATHDGELAVVLPRFPQLKHPPDRQPGSLVPASLPLAAVYVLETGPRQTGSAAPRSGRAGGDDQGGLAVEDLAGYEAALALIRHTVASRLFTDDLLRRHTDFCFRIARRIPIRRLRYPKRWDVLPEIVARLGC